MSEPKQDTLCWRCANADTNGCPWAENLIPVPGWEALRRDIKIDNGRTHESYIVFECPLYKRSKRRKRKEREMARWIQNL